MIIQLSLADLILKNSAFLFDGDAPQVLNQGLRLDPGVTLGRNMRIFPGDHVQEDRADVMRLALVPPVHAGEVFRAEEVLVAAWFRVKNVFLAVEENEINPDLTLQ